MTRFSAVLWMAGLAAFAGAQTRHLTPFTGAWKMNPAKSEFNPGPPFKAFTITFTPDGVRHLDLIHANGQVFQAELPWSGGKEVAVVVKGGGAGSLKAVSTIDGTTFRDTWKENGKVIEKVHGRLSPDGKTLTVAVEGPTPGGGAFHNRVVFDKQ